MAVTASGCGVLGVPEEARLAVADWADRTQESDPCRIDAMEHCVGGAAAAATGGSACAVFLGQLLEQQQRDGSAMDLHNNEIGAKRCAVPISPGEPTDGDGVPDAVACCARLLDSDPPSLEVQGPCN